MINFEGVGEKFSYWGLDKYLLGFELANANDLVEGLRTYSDIIVPLKFSSSSKLLYKPCNEVGFIRKMNILLLLASL